MGKGYKHGTSGGVSPLNFHVKTYPSETELKADKPKKNTIGIVPLATMTSWAFRSTEPTEPEIGMVWFIIGDNSPAEFNALVENTLQVYPISAKQYVSNEWKAIPAWSYQGEEWAEWFMYLYNTGNECTDITGGFYYEAKRPQSNQNSGGTASLTKNQSNMILTQTSTSGAFGSAICATNKKIDLTDVKNIVCDYSDVKVHHAYLCVWSAIGTYTTDNIVAKATILENGGEISEGKTSLDTTALSGEYVVGLYIQAAYSNTSTITINNIYCERG